MARLDEVVAYTNELLDAAHFDDYCPNGLQVAGADDIHCLVSGVTASQALLEAARQKQADAILVHHGYFWKGEDPCVTGMKKRRLQFLLAHDISLLAYHLPLDAHAELGNNAQLAEVLGLELEGRFARAGAAAIGMYGRLSQPMSAAAFADHVAERLQRQPLHVPGRATQISRVGWCTGAAQRYLIDAGQLGLDAYISGEVSEQTVHEARETGIHYFAAGHHATERYGARALGEHLAQTFNLSHYFIDIDNPV